MVLFLKQLVFSLKVLAKVKPGSNVIFKVGLKGTAWGLIAATPAGEVIVFVAINSLSSVLISFAAGMVIDQIAKRAIVYVWDEGLTEQFPELANTTSETGANIVRAQLGPRDIATLTFPTTRAKVASDIFESAVESQLGRDLTFAENVAIEAVQLGFALAGKAGPIGALFQASVIGLVVSVSALTELGAFDSVDSSGNCSVRPSSQT